MEQNKIMKVVVHLQNTNFPYLWANNNISRLPGPLWEGVSTQTPGALYWNRRKGFHKITTLFSPPLTNRQNYYELRVGMQVVSKKGWIQWKETGAGPVQVPCLIKDAQALLS